MTAGKKFADHWNSNNTLFAFYMGANDVIDVQFVNNTKSWSQNLDDILNVYFSITEKIYDIGGRHFLFLNVPPLYDAPLNAGKKYQYLTNTVPYFNYFLKSKVVKFAKEHPDSNVLLYNLHANYHHILYHYKEYNFISDILAWKTDPKSRRKLRNLNQYFWRDYTHISNLANKLIAEDIEELLESEALQ